MKNKKLIYTIGMLFMLVDQLIKLQVTKNMALFQEIKIIPDFFSIYYIENTGAAFSILGNQTILLIITSIICLLIIKNYIKKLTNITTSKIIALALLLGGILGNLFDRVLYGKVIDYLSFDIFSYSFPVFNLADIGITMGALLLIISLTKEEKIINKINISSKTNKTML